MRVARRWLSAVLVFSLTLPALAQQPPAPPPARPAAKPAPRGAARPPAMVPGPSVEGITEYTLGNGLRVLLFPDQSKPTTTVNITYLVGSRHEGYGETGMAHLLEHMLFKGSPTHRNIPQEFSDHGANWNGSTWFDRTNYFETFSASDTNLVWALDLEAARMVNSFVAKADLETEFTVVRNEFELGENSPDNVLEERAMSTAFLWHNYGHSTIGARSDIEQVPIERLQAFYRRYYQPDNAVLVVAGKFDEKRALALIQQKFAGVPKPDRSGVLKIYPTYTVDPVQDGERSVTLRRVGDVQVAMAVYHVPAGSHADFPAVDVLAHILGDAPSGRLYKALVESKKAADVSAYTYRLREPGVLITSAQVRRDDTLATAMSGMREATAAVLATPATKEEVDRAKAAIIKQFELTLNNSQRAALQLSEWAAMGDWRMMFLYRDRIKQVTPDDVARVAAAYLKPSNVTYGQFIPTDKPDRAEIPPTPDVAALVATYKGDTARVAGEAFDPSPGNIEARTTRGALNTGMKLAFLPKATRGHTVNVSLTLRFGTLDGVKGKAAASDLAADMLMRGTRTKSRQQIKDAFDQLQTNVSLGGGPTSLRVRMETTRANLSESLKLLAEVLREPAFDPKEFEQLRQQNLAGLDEGKSDPIAQGSAAYQRYLNPREKGDPRYTATPEEQIADYTSASLDDAQKFYAEYYGAENGQLAIVGDFDLAEAQAQIATLFGNWRSGKTFERIPNEYKDVPATTISIETPDKANAFFLAGTNIRIRDDNPDYPALVLANYILGGGALSSRLAVRIRQKEGISYGVGSSVSASSQDTSGSFTTYAIYAPENVARLEAAFKEEVDRAMKEGFTAEEVDKAKQGWLQNEQVRLAQDGQLAGQLATDLYIDRNLSYDADFQHKVGELTTEQVNTALRRYIDPSKITIVKAGDFAKKAPPAKP
ncbi:MAG TPA: pitrilysin family protein [Gemmatimonadales bacterium]|nr:pitrilysin family protein [Gemmatimonadales bacterium]